MPISREKRALYPKDWKAISARIRARAGERCECLGECELDHGGRCERRNGERLHRRDSPDQPWRTVLTTAHLDHNPTNCADDNLKSMCQRCHLRYDRKLHAENSAKTRDRKRGQTRFELT